MRQKSWPIAGRAVPPFPHFRVLEPAANVAEVVRVAAIIFGAGNVGRGFLGQLISEARREVVFVEIDPPLISTLNTRRSYTIRLVDNERTDEVTISPILRSCHPRGFAPRARTHLWV